MVQFIFNKGAVLAVLDSSHSSLFSEETLVTPITPCFSLPWLSKQTVYESSLQFFCPVLDLLQYTFCLSCTTETAPDKISHK